MLSDQGILGELERSRNGNVKVAFAVAGFPKEGAVDWNILPFSDQKWHQKNSPIQPSSLDLHVGRIFVPNTAPGKLGSEGHGESSYTLLPGQSVIVSTLESISLPETMGGIVFPPSRLSSGGILVANLGHIDPGFSGHLRFTLINMGAKEFSLERGSVEVGTLMLFRLGVPCAAPWSSRYNNLQPKKEPDQSEIDALAKSFAGIENRVRDLTRKIVSRMQWRFSLWAVFAPIVAAVLLAVLAIIFERVRGDADRLAAKDQEVAAIEQRLTGLEATLREHDRLSEQDLAQLRAEIMALQSRGNAFNPVRGR